MAAATELARFRGQHLIAPQAILFRAYLEQIFAGLRDAGLGVFRVVLMPAEKYCASVLLAPVKHTPGAWLIWPATGHPACR
jgi:hypothetical protein